MKNSVVIGNEYHMAGYTWVVTEIKGNCAVLQSTGITSGRWPGYVIPQFGNGGWYRKRIDGQDIHTYDAKMSTLYESIKHMEFTDAGYGKGLFLISDEKMKHNECGFQGHGAYWETLKRAAENFSISMALNDIAWLGTVGLNSRAWSVDSYGCVSICAQDTNCVIAPAFNIDLSKVSVNEDEITRDL